MTVLLCVTGRRFACGEFPAGPGVRRAQGIFGRIDGVTGRPSGDGAVPRGRLGEIAVPA